MIATPVANTATTQGKSSEDKEEKAVAFNDCHGRDK